MTHQIQELSDMIAILQMDMNEISSKTEALEEEIKHSGQILSSVRVVGRPPPLVRGSRCLSEVPVLPVTRLNQVRGAKKQRSRSVPNVSPYVTSASYMNQVYIQVISKMLLI